MLEPNATTPLEPTRQQMEAALLGLLPGDDEPERKYLYEAAMSTMDLDIVDYQLIRDLLCMADLPPDAALEAGIMALMVARQEGSLCLRLAADAIERKLPDFAQRSELCEQFVAGLSAGAYDERLVGHDDTAFRPLICHGKYLYFQRSLHDEKTLGREYEARLQDKPSLDQADLNRFRACVQDVLAAPPHMPSGEALDLNREQRWALGLALLQRFLVVTGGPGTGKTSIVLALLRCLIRLGVPVESIGLAAPTGRAAQRMTESLRSGLSQITEPTEEDDLLRDLEGQTLHRLLGYSPSRHSYTFGPDNPLSLDVLIVDEVSMIDATLMARLLEAVPATTRLILLGDAHQLPSVEAGAVLADLVPPGSQPIYSQAMAAALGFILPNQADAPVATHGAAGHVMRDRVVRLATDYRSVAEIQALARLVNGFEEDQAAALLERLRPDGACRLDEERLDGPAFLSVLKEWAEQHYLGDSYAGAIRRCEVPARASMPLDSLMASVLSVLPRARILAAVHGGPRGCVGINKYLSAFLRPRLDPGSQNKYFAGAPIMVTCNDYAQELYNGDTGIVLRDSEGGQRVAFARGDQVMLVPVGNLPEHVVAFAITVHKSQGSEFGSVLLVLPSENETARSHRLLSRQILYTAVTRAKNSILINSPRSVLLQACQNILERDSGLSLKLPSEGGTLAHIASNFC